MNTALGVINVYAFSVAHSVISKNSLQLCSVIVHYILQRLLVSPESDLALWGTFVGTAVAIIAIAVVLVAAQVTESSSFPYAFYSSVACTINI
jgi:hypothetical protein